MQEALQARIPPSTMSTILHEQGFKFGLDRATAGFMFDKNSIRGTYNHAQYLEGRREMMQWYGDFIGQAGKSGSSLAYAAISLTAELEVRRGKLSLFAEKRLNVNLFFWELILFAIFFRAVGCKDVRGVREEKSCYVSL